MATAKSVNAVVNRGMTALNRHNIIAGQFGDDGDDGWQQVQTRGVQMRAKHQEPRGAAFYPTSALKSVRVRGELYLQWGPLNNKSDAEYKTLAEEIVRVLRLNGCEVRWSGSPMGCIVITNVFDVEG